MSKVLYTAAFWRLFQVRNFRPLYVLFHFHLYFIFSCYLCRGNSFAVTVYNDVLGPNAAGPLVCHHRSLKTHGWPWAQIFIPMGFLFL